MKRSTSDVAGTIRNDSPVGLYGEWEVKVVRADGTTETKVLRNTVTARGMNRIAARALYNAPAAGQCGSAAAYIVVGTATAATADTDTQAQVGEVAAGRKIGTAIVQSREWFALTATWAGNADGLTSIALDSAAISDYANSWASDTGAGSGSIIFNRVNGLGVTLQASDFLNLTVRIRVGSHNQAHTN